MRGAIGTSFVDMIEEEAEGDAEGGVVLMLCKAQNTKVALFLSALDTHQDTTGD